ncbi:MAG: hypothetical protein RL766_1853 [Bacteroidota bacterium]|jgi:uncharacterized protein with HEPN domain
MLASNLELLRHISLETTFILKHIQGKTKEDFLSDDLLCHAIVRSLEIIGEAAKKIDSEFKNEYPHIEWKKMAGTRDKMIHDYFGVDYEIVWDIVEQKIPDLDHFVTEIINEN